MKVTCDKCGCDMKITSSFGYQCPECKHEVEMALIQDINKKYWDQHSRNIEWAKVKGEEVIVVK
jgi:tRNA(Ile2) C34 agmatinyltransferase TiaS